MSEPLPQGLRYRPWHHIPSLHTRIQKVIEDLADAQWDGDEDRVEELQTTLTLLISKEKMGDEYDPTF